MTALMGCDILSVNHINPYTETGTFGISWNGGYKPDPTIEYLPPDDNTVPAFSENSVGELPLFAIPPNIFLKTSEARRYNVLEGGIRPRLIQFDDEVKTRPVQEDFVGVETYEEQPQEITEKVDVKVENTIWDRFLVGIIIALLIVFIMSMKKSS
jgi:hypothetical protein